MSDDKKKRGIAPEKKVTVKDEHDDHLDYYSTLSDDLKGFIDEVYLLDDGKYQSIRLTSGKRDGNEHSHHHTGDAVDIAALRDGGTEGNELYSRLMNTSDGLALLSKYNLGIYDETDPAIMKKTGASGPHFHIGKDSGLFSNTTSRIGEFEAGNADELTSFYSQNPDFDYNNPDEVSAAVEAGAGSTAVGTNDRIVAGGATPLEVVSGDPNTARTFVQDVEDAKDKEEVIDERIEASDARKRIEEAKAQMLKAEMEKKQAFLQTIADLAKPEDPKKPRKKKPFQEEKFDMIPMQTSLPNLPTIHQLPNPKEFENGGVSGDDPKPLTKKQIKQQQYFKILNQLRGQYQHLDADTQQWVDRSTINFGGKKPIKGFEEKGFTPVTTEDFVTWRVSGIDFTPDPTSFVDVGVSGLRREDFETDELYQTAYDADRVVLAPREHPKYGNMYVPIGTGATSQKLAESFGKEFGAFKNKGKQIIPYYGITNPDEYDQLYYDWRQQQLGEFSSGVQEQKYGGFFFGNGGGHKGEPVNTSGPRSSSSETQVDTGAMNAMMKSRLAYAQMFGNPAAQRMVSPTDQPYNFGGGDTGTHYMSSIDNYAVPQIQSVDGQLQLGDYEPQSNESIRFDRNSDADYFANENYKRVSPVFKYNEGGEVISQHGWEYKKENGNYLTRRVGDNNWITARGGALSAIKNKVYQEVTATPTMTPEELVVAKRELKSFDPEKTTDVDAIKNTQRKLIEAGYDLGDFGPNKDGVDGVFGEATSNALGSFNSGIAPTLTPTPKNEAQTKVEREEVKDSIRTDLKPGVLPTLVRGTSQDICTEGQGCSGNAAERMGELFGDVAEGGSGALWTKDAWFNKDFYEKNGGDVIYETSERDVSQMREVPKELYDKFQIGDYVHLNRVDTPSSRDYASREEDGLENEGIEHMGFIIGKDEDGTPLVWHGSETGNAYVQRVDEEIRLLDHSDISSYQISSVVRNPALKNKTEELKKLGKTKFWTQVQDMPIDEEDTLTPSANATLAQKRMAEVVNESLGQFKALGYEQEDVAYLGQLLVGGIMENESSGGDSNRRVPKEIASVILKDVAGIVEGEASRGVYQLKPETNTFDAEGNENDINKQLKLLGVNLDELKTSSAAQTKAGLLIMLDNYAELKDDPDFDAATGLYKEKIPASYILSKSWQAGQGWYKKDKYKDLLDNLDVDYSWNALEGAVDNISIGEGYRNVNSDLNTAEEGAKAQYLKSDEYKEELRQQEVAREWAIRNSPNSQLYVESTDDPINVHTPLAPKLKNPKGGAKYWKLFE